MGTQIAIRRVRFVIDASVAPGVSPVDSLTGQPAQAYCGADLELDFGLFINFLNGQIEDVGNISYFQLDLKNPQALNQVSQIILLSGQGGQPAIDNTTTQAGWVAAGNQHAQFFFTGAQTNFGIQQPSGYTLELSAVTTAGKTIVFRQIAITFIPTGLGVGGSPNPTPPTYLTEDQSLALFPIMSGPGPSNASGNEPLATNCPATLVNPPIWFLFTIPNGPLAGQKGWIKLLQ